MVSAIFLLNGMHMENTSVRKSKKRTAILNYLKGNYSHPTAEKIYEDLKTKINDLSLGTVYRNLKFLENRGEVKSFQANDNKVHYEIASDSHIHFICRNCGEILDLKTIDDSIVDRLSNEYGNYLIEDISLTLYGLCPNCIDKK